MEALANSRADHSQKIALKHKLIKKEDKDDGHEFLGFSGHDKRKTSGACGKKGSNGATGGGSASSARCCQAESCCANLSNAKQYHKRHKVCEHHAKAQVVIVAGIRQRFCQQCSRFHEVSEFDDIKRSCRTRLAGHNERRRKSSSDHHSHAEAFGGGKKGSAGSSGHLKEVACGQQVVDNNYRGTNGIQMKFEDKPTFKHFQIK